MMECLKEDLNGLMSAKIDLFPNEKRPIISAKIENLDEKQYRVTASFARLDGLH